MSVPGAIPKLKSRLAVANWAIAALAPLAKANGTYCPVTASMPAYWDWSQHGCKITVAAGGLLLPDDPELSTLLDVWLDVGGKVLSVAWFADAPWRPVRVTRVVAGDWMYRLGWKSEA